MTCHYFWGLLWEAFRWGQMLSNRVTCDDVSLLRILTLGSLPSGTAPKLGNRITFDDFPLLWVVILGSLPLGTAA